MWKRAILESIYLDLTYKKADIILYQLMVFKMAEQKGFEPLHMLLSTSFPSPPLQPLGYCSKCLDIIYENEPKSL